MKRSIALPLDWAGRGYALRPARARDRGFQRALFEAERPDAAFIARLPAAQREAFLDSQFSLQDVHYRRFFAGAECLIVMRHGAPVGRLMVHNGARDWRLIDIGLLPDERSRGLGSALIAAVQSACAASGAEVLNLQVDVSNRARDLYERLGFSVTGDIGIQNVSHSEMSWRPASQMRSQLRSRLKSQLKTAS
jgi:ribosomal protein S18 acetylase RimI-like enzyme